MGKDFTIISNNCWGGGVYEDLALPYRTPTVGLFFFAPCYIKFVTNLKENLVADITFIKQSKYQKGNDLQKEHYYPIGLIGNDIEIHFLHYVSEEQAYDKWIRRKKRANFENLFLSFSDSEQYTLNELKEFDRLPFPKVFFSARPVAGIKSLVWLKIFKKRTHVGDIYTNRWWYRKYFNVVKWLNTGLTYNNETYPTEL